MSLVQQQKAQNLYLTTGISDPVVQQNFEKANKIQADLLNGRRSFPANFSYSEPASFSLADNSSVGFPVPLVAQIKTTGNPVQLQLASSPYNLENITGSRFLLTSTGASSGSATLIWQRVGNGKVEFLTAYQIDSGVGGKSSFSLPAFGFDDEVPAGIWTYKFGVLAIVRTGGVAGNVTLTMTWCRISLKELR